ncbi:phosphatidylglycerophosphatase A [Amaricoccus sp.]|uniref:phosphatidylglycerophosphatase A family protein n=1 Tax=Amaricoccus sp. TaxID=1872485 RepID=UPI0026022D6F|nr:phosphatidylglycerophosphatase A [Amaricoccus sp.]HRO12947.1 phosphatidylglycerophosphatase A [Amaricoccus sp.]
MTRLVATFGYIGLLPGPAGTWGSLAALGVGYLLHLLGGPFLLAAAIVAGYGAGHWATRVETFEQEDLDPAHIVIDEVVGQWIALMPLSLGLWIVGAPASLFPWPGWVGAFVFFRLFDIWKPGPVGWADRRPGPTGVMLDDVFAGLLAALVVTLLASISHGWLR